MVAHEFHVELKSRYYLEGASNCSHLVSYGNQKNFQYFMQRLKEEYPGGLELDSDWYKALIGKAIVFRTAQKIVRSKKFPAYQANIVAYTVAALAWNANGAFDFGLLWSRQTVSPELEALIGTWASPIDQVLRLTAGKRMVSEWAKKPECWHEIRETQLEAPHPVPPELNATAAALTTIELGQPQSIGGEDSESGREELICNIRHIFRNAEVRSRDDVLAALDTSGLDGNRFDELDNVIRTAVRRNILEHRGEGLALCTRNIADYERSFLKDQFVASIQGSGWTEREESIRRFSRWLGFRRTGPSIDETARSIINGLIREGRLESNGPQVRRR